MNTAPGPTRASAPNGVTAPGNISDALTRYYATHRLPMDGGASSPWFDVHVGSLTFRLPNPPSRQRAVFFHDINHLLTGYDTTFGRGEVEIAAFEVASGCGRFWIVWYINLSMFAIGLALNPRAVFRAFRRGMRASSIYHCADDRDKLAATSVQALRVSLGIGAEPPRAHATDWARFGAWAIMAVLVLLAPFAAAVMVVAAVLQALPIRAR